MAFGRSRQRGLIGTTHLWVRRVRRVLVLASVASGVYRWWQRGLGGGGGDGAGGSRPGGDGRPAPRPGSPVRPLVERATVPPEPELVSVTATATVVTDAGVDPTASWVAPLDDGGCPPGHPIKVNESSGIYHVPGGRSYERTVAGRCYATEEAAVADGFRASKT